MIVELYGITDVELLIERLAAIKRHRPKDDD